MNKGEIIYIGGFELPDKNAAAHRVRNIGKIFKEIGYDLTYIGINRQGKLVKEKTSEYTTVSVPYPATISERIKYYTEFNHIKKVIDQSHSIQAIVCYNCPSTILRKILKYAKKKNIKVLADITEWYGDKRPIKYLDTAYRMQLLHKKIDGAICISNYLYDYYNRFTPSIVIPPLLDLLDEKWNRHKYYQSNNIKLIYSGSLGRNKDDLKSVINGVLTANNIEFRVVGITKKEFLNMNPSYKYVLDNRIIFTGRVSHEKSIKYVTNSDFQIFLREDSRMNNAGFPTKFVESMACGTPVITTPTSDLSYYLIEGENGFFVDYGDAQALADVLSQISLMNTDEIHTMKENSKSIRVFDYRNYCTEIEEFLKKIL